MITEQRGGEFDANAFERSPIAVSDALEVMTLITVANRDGWRRYEK